MAPYGQDPLSKQWMSPFRLRIGLESKQQMTPESQDRLCYIATQTGSYEAAARVAAKCGMDVDPSCIFQHVQRIGQKTRTVEEQRVEQALDVNTRAQVIRQARIQTPKHPFSLVIMIDGWMIRERGEDWALKPPDAHGSRVEWREMKTGIVFRIEDRVQTHGGRHFLLEKFYVAYRGDPDEFSRRIYAQALRRGLAQAQAVYVVADGAVWIWNLVRERFPQAKKLLDFYHLSEHLWIVARALFDDEKTQRQWVVPLLHKLKHGQEESALNSLHDLQTEIEKLDPQAKKDLHREMNYFQTHSQRMQYQENAEQGCPIGSGAVESTCAQFQKRFKASGQFWTTEGHANLMALDLARRNQEWDDIWLRDVA